MKQMTLPLDEFQQRPVVRLNRLRALLDTGAYIPVWLDDEEILTSVMGGTLIRKDVEFAGFGGTTKGNLYRVMQAFFQYSVIIRKFRKLLINGGRPLII